MDWLESQLEEKARLQEDNARLKECAQKDGEKYNEMEEEIARLEEEARDKAAEYDEEKERLQEETNTLEIEAQDKAAEEDEEKERLQEEIDTLEADMEAKAQEEEEKKQELLEEIEVERDVSRSLGKRIRYLECEREVFRERRLKLGAEVERLKADAVAEKARFQTEIGHWRWYATGAAMQAYTYQFHQRIPIAAP